MPKSARQMDLFTPRQRRSQGWDGQYGGDSRLGMRKVLRPIDPSLHLHVVLRAERARGEHSLLHRRHRARVEAAVHRGAARFKIRILRFKNVGNHLHLLVRTPNRPALGRFLRSVAGVIARGVLGRQRGPAGSSRPARRFWDGTAYTRLVSWGRQLRALHTYLNKNRLESVGFRGAYLKIAPGGRPCVVVGDERLWRQYWEACANPRAPGPATSPPLLAPHVQDLLDRSDFLA